MNLLWNDRRAREFLQRAFDRAVARADPRAALAPFLPKKPRGRCVVVGAGKASATMAAAVDAAWPDVELCGLVVTRYGHAVPAGRINVIEAGHPLPDDNSGRAAREMLTMVRHLEPEDLVLALMSGGGSSLLCLPRDGLTLQEKAAVHRALLHSGASIAEMNIVRSALSDIKAGHLAGAAHPARVVTLLISDVAGDTAATIASGPTIPVAIPKDAAKTIVERYSLQLPAAARRLIESPRPGAAQNGQADIRFVATPFKSLQAAAELAVGEGVTPLILGDAIEGDAREVAKVMAGIACSASTHGVPAKAPMLLISGGETTVKLPDVPIGKGGRNTDFLLAFSLAIAQSPGIWAIAADTDGIDGSEDAAGAILGPDTLARGQAAGLSANAFLDRFDSYSFFRAIGDLIVTGPTRTNVNDFRAILVT